MATRQLWLVLIGFLMVLGGIYLYIPDWFPLSPLPLSNEIKHKEEVSLLPKISYSQLYRDYVRVMNETIDLGELAPGDTLSIMFSPWSMSFEFTNGSYWARATIMTDRGTPLKYSEFYSKIVAASGIRETKDSGEGHFFTQKIDTVGVGYAIQIQGRGYGNLDFQADLEIEVFTRPYQSFALPLIGLGLLVIIVAFVWRPASRVPSAQPPPVPPPPAE